MWRPRHCEILVTLAAAYLCVNCAGGDEEFAGGEGGAGSSEGGGGGGRGGRGGKRMRG